MEVVCKIVKNIAVVFKNFIGYGTLYCIIANKGSYQSVIKAYEVTDQNSKLYGLTLVDMRSYKTDGKAACARIYEKRIGLKALPPELEGSGYTLFAAFRKLRKVCRGQTFRVKAINATRYKQYREILWTCGIEVEEDVGPRGLFLKFKL